MKIQSIETGAISLPLRRPFKTALRTVERIEDVAVRVTTADGAVGYGEAPPTAVITGDTTASILCAIREYIRPALVGMELEDFEAVMARLHGCMAGNHSPKAAVDMALYDLYGQLRGEPAYRLLGGARRELRTDLTISVNPAAQMVADSLEAVAQGFDILKIKVGRDGAQDVARARAIRAAVGPGVRLRIDANQGWQAGQAVRIIHEMEDAGLDIELVEQPVPARDFWGMQYVAQRVDTPILADEAVFSPEDARILLDMGAADMINIKLMKTGGIHEALKICDLASAHGVQCMVGCMLESRLSVAASAHLAAGRQEVTMADLDGPSLCLSDPYAGGPEFAGEVIRMTEDAGIGVRQIPCERWS